MEKADLRYNAACCGGMSRRTDCHSFFHDELNGVRAVAIVIEVRFSGSPDLIRRTAFMAVSKQGSPVNDAQKTKRVQLLVYDYDLLALMVVRGIQGTMAFQRSAPWLDLLALEAGQGIFLSARIHCLTAEGCRSDRALSRLRCPSLLRNYFDHLLV